MENRTIVMVGDSDVRNHFAALACSLYEYARARRLPVKLENGGTAVLLPSRDFALRLIEYRLPVKTRESRNGMFEVPEPNVHPAIEKALSHRPDVLVIQFGHHIMKRPRILNVTSPRVPRMRLQ